MSRRSLAAVSFVLAALASGAYIVFVFPGRYCSEPPLSAGRPDPARVAARAALEREREFTADAPTPARESARTNAVADLPPRGVKVAPEDAVELRVVLASSGAPVSGALVRGLGLLEPSQEPDPHVQLAVGVLDPEARLEGTPSYVTDARGIARVPKRSLPADYSASAGELWGKTYCSDGVAPPFTIELEPDATVRVHVVDAHGRAAGRQELALGCASSPRDELWSALTDDEGFLLVRHVAAAAQKCLDPEEVVVRPVLLEHDEVVPVLVLDPRATVPESRELTLPKLGRVEVAVRARDGRPLAADGVVLARPEDLATWGGPKSEASVWRPDSVERGLAVFEGVGLGVDVCACVEGLGRERVHVLGRSSEAPDGVARIELVVDEPWPVLTGRLLDVAGRPLCDVEASWRAPAGGGCVLYLGADSFRTDVNGRFRLLHRGSLEISELWARDVRVEWLDRDGVRHGLRPALPKRLSDGENELGDLRFAPTRVVARGVVLDAGGAAIADEGTTPWFTPIDGHDSGFASSTDVHRKPGGEFEVFSECLAEHWRVQTRAPGFEETETLEFDAGANGLRVVLGAGGSIRGRLVLEPGVASERVGVHVLRTDGGEHAPVYLPIAEDGSFRFGASRSGTFTLVVEHAAWGTLVELAGLVLEGDGDCTDPRVASIRVAAPEPTRR